MPYRIDPETFGFVVADVARLMRHEFDRLTVEAGFGLTPGETRALSHAARAGTVRQTALADLMGIEAMTLSAYLDRLEARGLVSRTPDPTDRRAKLVQVTEAAGDVLIAMRSIGAEGRRTAAAGLSTSEWETLQTLLKRVRANLSEARDEERKKPAA